jgi:hypothetical protein
MNMERLLGWELAGETEVLKESLPLSTTNPTWPDLGSNPGCSGGKPATNRLSYGTTTSPCVGSGLKTGLSHVRGVIPTEVKWSVSRMPYAPEGGTLNIDDCSIRLEPAWSSDSGFDCRVIFVKLLGYVNGSQQNRHVDLTTSIPSSLFLKVWRSLIWKAVLCRIC